MNAALQLSFVGLCVALSACPSDKNVPCQVDSNCNLSPGGLCAAARTGNKWCAYPDSDCSSGHRFSDEGVGDDQGGLCIEPQLTVMIGGTGAGAVSSIPEGLVCTNGMCSGAFPEGTQVELTATASEGSFLGWSEACRGNQSCLVTLDRNQVVRALFGDPGATLWMTQLGSSGADSASQVAIDSQGNLIVVGEFSETMTLPEGIVLQNAGVVGPSFEGYDIFVVKVASSTGTVVWARSFGSVRDDRAFRVAIDQSDNIYVFGTFMGTVDFDGEPLNAGPGFTDSKNFVLKLEPNFGDRVWVRSFTGLAIESSLVARADSVVLTGSFVGSLTADTSTLTSAGDSDIAVINMEAESSAVRWAKSFGGTRADNSFGAAIDGNGNVVVSGQFRGIVNFGGGPLSASADFSDMFLLKLSPTGAHLLSKQFGGPGNDRGDAVAVDSANNIIVIGAYMGSVDFGCIDRPTSSQADLSDVFVAKFTQAGACDWVKGFGGTGTTRLGSAVAVNKEGEIATTGTFCGLISFGGQPLRGASECPALEVFAARFSPTGTHLNSVRGGGTDIDRAWGVAQASDGRFFVSGEFRSFAEFGSESRTSAGGSDAFVVGLAPF